MTFCHFLAAKHELPECVAIKGAMCFSFRRSIAKQKENVCYFRRIGSSAAQLVGQKEAKVFNNKITIAFHVFIEQVRISYRLNPS